MSVSYVHTRHAVRGAWALVVAALFCVAPALLCALPAQGQVIPEEGFPTKPVFPEESTVAPGLHEECGPFLPSGEFGEECAGDIGENNGGNNGPGAIGSGFEGAGSSADALDPAWRTPPRLACPSAVFLEELETGAIDCHASDAAGAEHLEYFWEPIGAATQNYLENPRLTPEDVPNPVVVAPSFPQFETLESFLSEEGMQRYRYRLTATSRATGLSSWSEVEVFVLSSRPSVYCPLELEVAEGGAVALACEGADPLSFRMDDGDDAGASPALWEWAGLWGASTAPLTAVDTQAPLFTAPEGSAGRTYHYVASMTTRSSGVLRTARRRVSVTVAAGEAAGFGTGVSPLMGNPPPVIICKDIDRYVENHLLEIDIDCRVTNLADVPSDATYSWASLGPAGDIDRLVAGTDSLTPTFRIDYSILPNTLSATYRYEVTLSGSGIADVTEDVTVTIRKVSDLMTCTPYYTVYTDADDFPLNCQPNDPDRGTPSWDWTRGGLPLGTSRKAMRLYDPKGEKNWLNRDVESPTFNPMFDVPDFLSSGKVIEYYTYFVCMYYDDGTYADSDLITVEVNQTPEIILNCTEGYLISEGSADFPFECEVRGLAIPEGAEYTYAWTEHEGYDDLLSATDILNPTFMVPDSVDGLTGYAYDLTVSLPDVPRAEDKTAQVIVHVDDEIPPPEIVITCPGNPYTFVEGDYWQELDCRGRVKNYRELGNKPGLTYRWKSLRSPADEALLERLVYSSGITRFKVPYTVTADETYEYRVTVSASSPGVTIPPKSADIKVTVINKPALGLSCTDITVYEGDPEFILPCDETGAPPKAHGFTSFSWSPDYGLLKETPLGFRDAPPPTFTPPEVDQDTEYAYDITISIEKQQQDKPATAPIIVTVLNKPEINVTCAGQPYSAYEGAADFPLDCTATDAPTGSSYTYEWTARSAATDMDLLSATNSSSPTFDVPDMVAADETHEYLLTVSAEHAKDGALAVDVEVLDTPPIVITCADHPYSIYEGAADFPLNCTADGAPTGSSYTYAWTARNTGSVTDLSLLDDPAALSPTFAVPGNVDADETHEYLLTVSADNAVTETFDVDVTVLNKATLALACTDPAAVYEGAADIPLDCTPSAQPALPSGSSYAYAWAWMGAGADPNLLVAGAGGAVGAPPTFETPLDVDGNQTYPYRLTLSADHSDAATEDVTITVLDKPQIVVACTDPDPAYEGADDFALACTADGAPAGSVPVYEWTARNKTGNAGAATDLSLLSAVDIASPTFAVPDEVAANETHEYTLTVTAANAEPGSANVTVEVLDKPQIVVACTDPDPVYEGSEDFALNCTASGAPDGSTPVYAWSARGDTPDTGRLSATDILSPTFDVLSSASQTTRYEYTLTVSAENAEAGTEEVTVRVLNEGAISLACSDPDPVYEGADDISLSCEASGAPGEDPVYSYVWEARGSTEGTDLLSAAVGASPTFYVPDTVEGDETYAYTVRATADNAEAGTAEVTVEVLDKPLIVVACTEPDAAYEGAADFALSCTATGAPDVSGDDPDYKYAWTARNTGLLRVTDPDLLSAADVASPMFLVPAEVPQTTTYEYLLTVTALNAEDGTEEVSVTVLNKGDLTLACANPAPAYEDSGDITLNCTASGPPGAPENSNYEYIWAAHGSTPDTDLLSAVDAASPTFYVPAEVDADETYEYLVTASAENAEDATAEVIVTVLDKETLVLACTDPAAVYESSPDITLDCAASGAPGGSSYAYVWAARGSTADTDRLVAGADGPTPTFDVPDDVPQTTRYEYLLTVSADNAEDATAAVTVTVLDSGVLTLTCANPDPVYEGSGDLALNCTASSGPGGPDGSAYDYVWAARGSTTDTGLLSAADVASPVFRVPAEVDADETYEYRVTVSAENAEAATAEVTVTVLNKPDLALACVNPAVVYEGSPDIVLNCEASGAPGGPDGSAYEYIWAARGATPDADLLSAADVASPTFYVPAEVDADETYEYLVTVSAENAEDAMAEVTVTVLNKPNLTLACANPAAVYEGSEDITLDCSATGAPDGSAYEYIWAAHGATTDTDLLSAADIASPTFYVPAEVDADEAYEYLLTVSAEHAEDAMAEVTVTVLDKEALALACTDPAAVYEGSPDIALNCEASGAPGAADGFSYTYAWEGRGATLDTDRLVAGMDGPTPTFDVPDAVDMDETYEYLLTVSAEHAEDATAEVTVTVLDRIEEVAFSIDPSGLGVRTGVSSLRFGVQSSDTQVSLDALTDRISTSVSGPYHAGRMTLAPDGDLALDERGEVALSIEMVTPVVLRRMSDETADETTAPVADKASDKTSDVASDKTSDKAADEIADATSDKIASAAETASSILVLSPSWSMAESCEQLSSQAIGGLHTEARLSESDCRMLLFGGDLDLSGAPTGRYSGTIDVILRTGAGEETHSAPVEVTVAPAQRVITIGPGGVRFDTSREVPAGLTAEQNVSIYPDVAYLTREAPSGAFELSNPSLIPLEVSVSARFGYTEATETGQERVVEDPSVSRLGDLSALVEIYPQSLVLMPGEQGVVRYGVREEALAEMTEAGYAAFFDVVSAPRQYVRTDQLPEEATSGKTARVTMRVPGAYAADAGALPLRAELLSVSQGAALSATFLVKTDGAPFLGEVAAYDGDGRELGRRRTLAYTRSRVRISLDRLPEGEAVFLRFAPSGSGRISAPVSVPWNAPRRDVRDGREIGAALGRE